MTGSYQKPLRELLKSLSIDYTGAEIIASLAIDSRQVDAGTLFFAYPGTVSDGRDYIEAAQQAGAAAIVYEAAKSTSTDEPYELPESITVPAFPVERVQHKVGEIAHEFFGSATEKLQVFGVTGTNGKTTCCYLLLQALTQLGTRAAMIGTIGNGALNDLSPSLHTTPDPISLHRLLAEFQAQGFTQICMEVSSHALDQGRVNGVKFFCSLFTNLTHDHLDYHGDMPTYAAAKQRLFTDFPSKLVICNADDSLGASLPDIADTEFVVSFGDTGDVSAEDVELFDDGITLFIDGSGVEFQLRTSLVGKINVSNITLLVATLLALSVPVEEIQEIVQNLVAPVGRMQLYSASDKPKVIIDYAHTPDALEKALLSVKEHCAGDLWCVFGCGGDRDQAKRPLMGAVAQQYSDVIIVTNDNPRSEEPQLIAEQITAKLDHQFSIVLDRAEAIRSAINSAKPADWILVAGKGHEATQEIDGVKYPLSDQQQVKQALGLEVAA